MGDRVWWNKPKRKVSTQGSETQLKQTSKISFIETAWAWNGQHGWGTGGGMSRIFQAPGYQAGLRVFGSSLTDPSSGSEVPMRTIPDISSVADPLTPLLMWLYGRPFFVGGTGVSAATSAVLFAITHHNLKNRLPFVNTVLYSQTSQKSSQLYNVISIGNNIAPGADQYRCGIGFSAVVGFGSVKGNKLVEVARAWSKHKVQQQAEKEKEKLGGDKEKKKEK